MATSTLVQLLEAGQGAGAVPGDPRRADRRRGQGLQHTRVMEEAEEAGGQAQPDPLVLQRFRDARHLMST